MCGEEKMKIICCIRVHNSSWIINHTLDAIAPCVDGIVIHDHNSTDNTIDLCIKNKKVLDIFQTKDSEYHEGRDKSILLNMAKKYNPEWIFMLDDDEIVFNNFKNVLKDLMNIKDKTFAFPLLYLWGESNKVRIDMPWRQQFRTKLFRNTKDAYFELKKCHCSPQHNHTEILASFPILHYGYIDQKLIDSKLELYKTFDEKTNGMKRTDLEKAFIKEGKYCTLQEAIDNKVWEK